jgi:hypothetical protein
MDANLADKRVLVAGAISLVEAVAYIVVQPGPCTGSDDCDRQVRQCLALRAGAAGRRRCRGFGPRRTRRADDCHASLTIDALRKGFGESHIRGGSLIAICS